MKYNIDTKENFDILTPQIDTFSHDLAEEITFFIQKNIQNKRSVIIDFSSIKSIEESSLLNIVNWHHELYNDDLSFSICNLNENIKNELMHLESADILNIAPKLIEAIDIVSMENLERELLGGDDLDF